MPTGLHQRVKEVAARSCHDLPAKHDLDAAEVGTCLQRAQLRLQQLFAMKETDASREGFHTN